MDYAPIEAFLIGRCGKTITQSALTSLHEYELLVEGHAKVEQEQWERLRWEVFMQWAISPNLKRRPRTPQDIIRFPWEKETAEAHDIEPLTESEVLGLCEIFKIKREDVNNG
jgi:hypothetical protein